MAGDVSNAAASLNAQRSALDQEASGVTSQVNALTSAIAQLNQQIQSTSPNADAGTLEDQRQQDLSQLSQLIGINQVTTENNGLSITTTSGQLLVSEGSSFQLTTGTVGGVTHFFVGTTDVTAQLAAGGGQLGGYLTARDQDIPSAASLDQLAYSVSTQVNALNNAGTDLDGVTGGQRGQSALHLQSARRRWPAVPATMSVVDDRSQPDCGRWPGAGNRRQLECRRRWPALASQSIVNGQSPTNYYSNFVTTLGSTVSGVQTENTAQNASVTQLQTQNNALSSVNLNDEASVDDHA